MHGVMNSAEHFSAFIDRSVVSHQRKVAAVCFVYGSVKTAPGISSGLRVTGVLALILSNLLTTVTP